MTGRRGLEIVVCLAAWVLCEPKSLYLTRGNHETKVCTERSVRAHVMLNNTKP